ncbi:Exportin-4 [Ilyodon furcidens]|uniref:Exportin-4 n=1 Tax=Ilyodon furcidens TaxID=33524 RepID=A0ABV0UU92_9TELE
MEAVVREWILLEKTSIESLRAFLLTYVLQRPNLQKYVREQILLAVAVIVKRGSLDKSINCKSIFHEVGQLISSGNPTVVKERYTSEKRISASAVANYTPHTGFKGIHFRNKNASYGKYCY